MINSVKKIKCPKCGEMHEVTVWESINTGEAPDLKADILARKINIMQCRSCNTTAIISEPLLYTDEEKKLMIYFAPCGNIEDKRRLYNGVRENTREEIKKIKGYNLRFVSEYNELMEKILVFDNGLNDKVTEFLKVLILVQEPEKAENRVIMFGKLENDYIEFIVQDKKEQQVYTTNIPMSTYDTLKNEIKMSGVKDYSFDWEIVDTNYASGLLTGMNNQ